MGRKVTQKNRRRVTSADAERDTQLLMKGNHVMKRMLINIAFTALLCGSLVGCSTVQQSVVRSQASYDSIWKACIDSLSDVRFSVSSTDKESGLIIADQGVVSGGGSVSRLNIMLTKSVDGVSVSVKFVPPPGTIGGWGNVDAYIKALKERIPDLVVSNTK
jgi:hypothetical protein